MENKNKLIGHVNKIIQKHLDRALSYQQARSQVDDSNLKKRFEECMQQSNYFADKLQVAMDLQGLYAKGRPSWHGTLLRAWMVFRVSLSHRRDITVVHSCLAGEKMIHLRYERLCSNKYLEFNYPLLKYTFLKQHFSLKNTREDLESFVELLQSATSDLVVEAEPSYSTVHSIAGNSSVS